MHLVRLRPDARDRVSALRPERVERLEAVWAAATAHAAARQITSYGVIVLRGLEGGWLVAAVEGSAEGDFTLGRCTS